MNDELERLLRVQAIGLVFVPSFAALRRFVMTGAFEDLASRLTLHYVVPAGTLAAMRAAAADRIASTNISEVSVTLEPPAADQPRERDGLLVAASHDGGPPLPEIVGLLNRLSPLACFVLTSSPDLFCHHVAWACEREKVGCVILQNGWSDVSGTTIHRPPTPVLACWGPESARHVKGVERLDHIVVERLGAPHYDLLKSADSEDRPGLRRALGVGSGERLLLFAGSWPPLDEIKVLRRLERAISEGRFTSLRVVYQPHPRGSRECEEEFKRHQWRHVTFHARPPVSHPDHSAATADTRVQAGLLFGADAVMGPPSALLIESLILERPTMVMIGREDRDIRAATPEMTRWRGLNSSKALVWSAKKKRLLDDCDILLRTTGEDRIVRRRARLADTIATRAPGTYAQRLARLYDKTLAPRLQSLRYKRAGAKRATISHTYGAHEVAAGYCEMSPEAAIVPGYWMHGWIPAYHNVAAGFIALHKRALEEGSGFASQIRHEQDVIPQFVSREDQADFLRAQGYRHVRAIGLPIVYVPEQRVRRVPGSLLVLPPHGQKSHGPGDLVAERYAEVIADLKPRFEQIVVGLTEDDFTKHEWVTSFRRHGIDVVMTAQQSDRGTIARLSAILSGFEYVTTNGFGSQIAYAAYCGAKVSVYGPYANFSRERMALVDIIRAFPELLDQAVYLCSEDALRKHYPFLFVDPDKAQVWQEWGAREVGEPCRVSPDELARVFGWTRAQAVPRVLARPH